MKHACSAKDYQRHETSLLQQTKFPRTVQMKSVSHIRTRKKYSEGTLAGEIDEEIGKSYYLSKNLKG
jgi:hypothetical protein